VTTLVFALIVSYSGVGKIRRDPLQVKVLHETIGIPFKYFSLLAACEFAGTVGIVFGIWWPPIGIAAGIGLVLYFVAAIGFHLRAGDVKGIGSAAFMLVFAAGALALRILTIQRTAYQNARLSTTIGASTSPTRRKPRASINPGGAPPS